MKFLLIFALNLILVFGHSELNKAFTDNEIIPDVISAVPEHKLKIEYVNGKHVKLGNELHPKDVKEIPTVNYEDEKDHFYTLILTDPDAPSRKNPVEREFNHWLVVNIPGNDISKGETITEYVGSGPPKDSGLHRYVFLLYKQAKKLDFSGEVRHSKTDGKRGNFSSSKFAEKYKLGNPAAGNFYQAAYDDSVPALHKQLGF